jgi:adenine-specific DNA methylase
LTRQRWVKTIELQDIHNIIGTTTCASATKHPLPDDSAQCFITDPPYYYSVQYAGLSDFFYVWLKRSIGEKYPELFSGSLTPKDEEIVVSSPTQARAPNGKNNLFFEKQMCLALSEGRRVCRPDGIGVFVFAHLQTAAWESFLQSLIDAGWIITATWPIDTERPGRIIAMRQSVLGSSIHLVCRPRENPDGSLSTDDIGDWRDVLSELPKRIHDWMPCLAEEGVVGADAIFACLGPALEIYSRYSSVEKASGEKVELKEYLEQVWATVSREALKMIFEGADASGFEEDARLTAMWLWTLRTAANGNNKAGNDASAKSLTGYSLEYDAARMIAQGLGAHLENLSHLVEIKGNTAMLLSAEVRTRYLFGKDAGESPKDKKRKKSKQIKFDFEGELKQMEEESGNLAGNLSGRAGATVLDHLHQSMILFGAGRGEALKRFLVDDGIGMNPLYWRLAQALSALYPSGTDEKRWVDGVLARKKGLGF